MCGSATLATLVSSTSMNVASITVAGDHPRIDIRPRPAESIGVMRTVTW